jgi:hypothetical protein
MTLRVCLFIDIGVYSMLVNKPSHNSYALSGMSNDDYKIAFSSYSKAKRYGLRGICSWASGAGLLGVIKDAAKGSIIDYGKRKLAAISINGALYICTPAVMVFTNATRVVKWAGRVHSTTAFVFECIEDSTNLAFLPIDMVVFGQPVPVGEKGRFELIDGYHDFVD